MNHELKVEKFLETIVFCLKLIGLLLAMLTIAVIVSSVTRPKQNRYQHIGHDKVLDRQTGEISQQ